MRYKTTYALGAQLVDHDGSPVASEQAARRLDGLACCSDSVLNYMELPFSEECGFRGGHPRLVVDERRKLTVAVQVDSVRKLSRKELGELKADFEGQLTDGIGAGCFDELSTATGVAVTFCFPLRAKCTQVEGIAWRPKASTEAGNAKRIAETARIIAKLDANSASSSRSTRQTAKKRRADKNRETKKVSTKPNLKALFRLLAKPERDQLFDQIKSELEACGNELSMVEDGEYPYGNFNDPKLLRLLLNAGLPPETTDVKGNSLLIQAAVNPKCVELLLKRGAHVNRVCDSHLATTALIRAASLGKRKSVEVLLDHGADPTIKGKSGESALDVVDKHSRERQAIMDLLRSGLRG